MKKLILEITYEDQAGLLSALNTIKGRNMNPGAFRSVRAGYSATGFLMEENINDYRLVDGEHCVIVQSKMND